MSPSTNPALHDADALLDALHADVLAGLSAVETAARLVAARAAVRDALREAPTHDRHPLETLAAEARARGEPIERFEARAGFFWHVAACEEKHHAEI